MRKTGDASGSYECALRSSLSAIKLAHEQLRLLTCTGTTASVLAWQIELCDVLLVEIAGIRNRLAKDLNCARGAPQPFGQNRFECLTTLQ
jgi:hypothetical protein